ncbi:hypothetical protein T12_5109 [Trichinella patagoniensis]|uniref:Uncharacterized protein n=1 Tax=Trichinella patagoniensis TaxID=990121 RepID=A0A0V0ZG59_9BILA|nr:hypothetical protein T12_5109 [Trichinella patagoniensis]
MHSFCILRTNNIQFLLLPDFYHIVQLTVWYDHSWCNVSAFPSSVFLFSSERSDVDERVLGITYQQ